MSNLWDIIKTVGGAVVSTVVPGGAAIVRIVNEMLPDDEKLPMNATGDDVRSAVKGLPPEKQAEIKLKEFEVNIENIKQSNETLRAMLEADARSTHTTRPKIALGSFHIIAFVTIVIIAIWSYAVTTGNVTMIKAVMEGWPFIASITGPLVTLLWAYFGVLRNEHKTRMDAVGGNAKPGGLAGAISSIVSAIKR